MKMKYSHCVLAGLIAAMPYPALATDHGAASISNPITISTAFLFNTSVVRAGTPACVPSGNRVRWAVNITTTAGQTAMSLVMAAYAQQKRIAVSGSNTCSAWSDTETADAIIVE